MTTSGNLLLDGTNWQDWRVQMNILMSICYIDKYINGIIARPDQDEDPVGAANWDHNDKYAMYILRRNISQPQLIHINHCKTSNQVWQTLEAIFETRNEGTAISYQRTLFECRARDGDNIDEHINLCKKYVDRINNTRDENFSINDANFKGILISSLPPSWDAFTQQYIGMKSAYDKQDQKKLLSSNEIMGIIKEEYFRRNQRDKNLTFYSEQDKRKVTATAKNQRTLASRISSSGSNRANDSRPACKHCGKTNHEVQNCRLLGRARCSNCKKIGHDQSNCWQKKKKGKSDKKEKEKETDSQKNAKDESSNQSVIVGEMSSAHIEEMSCKAEEAPMESDQNTNYDGECYGFDTYQASDEIDERLIYYDWYADSATTSHIANSRDAFSSYQPTTDTSISGVGEAITRAEGRGTVTITSKYNGQIYALQLQDVLHVPTNKNNLFSLGRWDAAGNTYSCKGGILTLWAQDTPVAMANKTTNNLYLLDAEVKRETNTALTMTANANSNMDSWLTWHKRFGHIGYTGLQTILDHQMVNGFTVNPNSQKSDCTACIQAKMSERPFGPATNRKTEIGELTHMDLWGKYDVASIHGNQYYLLMIDDASRFVCLDFLKAKSDASRYVKNHFTYLQVRGKRPRALRVDRGTEFLNQDLRDWCAENGIEIQSTAPYSPSQNGVAERMNRTLTELARAMLISSDLPEFLWQQAIAHASYVRNRAYTKALPYRTPYEYWHGEKPNISHLREFGAPVWILSQGQQIPRKMLSKAQRRAYVGYDDGSKSVLFYNAPTRKILISRNFHFLTPSEETPSENIVVTPSPPLEGESEGSTRVEKTPNETREDLKRKADEDIGETRRTRGKRIDYKHLDDPFSDEEMDINKDDPLSVHNSLIATIGDDYHSLKEAKLVPGMAGMGSRNKGGTKAARANGNMETSPKTRWRGPDH
jgi:hypothetical protein